MSICTKPGNLKTPPNFLSFLKVVYFTTVLHHNTYCTSFACMTAQFTEKDRSVLTKFFTAWKFPQQTSSRTSCEQTSRAISFSCSLKRNIAKKVRDRFSVVCSADSFCQNHGNVNDLHNKQVTNKMPRKMLTMVCNINLLFCNKFCNYFYFLC